MQMNIYLTESCVSLPIESHNRNTSNCSEQKVVTIFNAEFCKLLTQDIIVCLVFHFDGYVQNMNWFRDLKFKVVVSTALQSMDFSPK